MTKKFFYQKWLFALLLLIGSMQIQAQCNYDAYVTTNSSSCGNYGITITPEPNVIYSNDFSSGPCVCSDSGTYQIVNDAQYNSTLGNVQLIPDQNNKNGKITFNSFTTAMPTDWEVKFKFFMTNKSGADGFSFNLGNNSFGGNNEDGVNQGLAIRFKTFNQDKISVVWNGTELQTPTDMTIEKGIWMDVKATVIAGRITLYVNGRRITNNLLIPSYAQNNNYRMIFAGRTGGASNNVIIDDVSFANAGDFEYSIDNTTYQTSNVFTNITLPANRTLPIWLKQNGCAANVRDFVYPSIGNNDFLITQAAEGGNTFSCTPDRINFFSPPINDVLPSPYKDRQKYIFTNLISKDGYTIGNSATQTSTGVLLTKDEGENHGYLIVEKPESFSPTEFEIEIKHKALAKSGADGFSINFGNPTPIVNGTVDEENGVTSGLSLRCKTNGQDNLSLYYNNVQIGTTYNPSGLNLESGSTVTIGFAVKGTTVSVYLNGVYYSPVMTATLPATYATTDFSTYKFIVAARTGGGSNENLISDLSIYNLQKLQVSKDNITFTTISETGDGTFTLPSFINVTPADVDYSTHTLQLYYRFLNGCNYTTSSFDQIVKYQPAQTSAPATQTVYGNSVTGANIITPAANALTNVSSRSYRIAGVGFYATLNATTVLPTGTYEVYVTTSWNNTVNDCTNFKIIVVEVKPVPAPTGNAIQIYVGDTPTIADLTANVTLGGSNLTWYDAATGGNVLTAASPLVNGTIYYVEQTVAGQVSPRLAVTAKRIADTSINICNAPASFTYASLEASNTTPTNSYSVEWFADNNANTAKYPSTTIATNGVKYIHQRKDNTVNVTMGEGLETLSSYYVITQNSNQVQFSNGKDMAEGPITTVPKAPLYNQGSNQAFDIKNCWSLGDLKSVFLATNFPLTANPNYTLRKGLRTIPLIFSSEPVEVRLGSTTGSIVTNILQYQPHYVLLADKSLCKLVLDQFTTPPLKAHTLAPILNNVEFFRYDDYNPKFLIGEANAIKIYDVDSYTTPKLTINNTGRVIDIAQTNNGDIFAIVENASNVIELVSYDKDGNNKIIIESPTITRHIENYGDRVIWPLNNQGQTSVTMSRPLVSNKVPVTVNLTAAFDTSIINVANNTLSVINPTPGATYQWLECDGNDIAGATSSTFTAPFSGSFQVRVTKDGCFSLNSGNCINVTFAAPSAVVLTQIGNEGDSPNTVTSVVTTTQLGLISPAITGIVTANEAAYQAYIDANPNSFSEPATAAEVQAMVTAVNAQVAAIAASNAVLTQIGNEADEPSDMPEVPSVVTTVQLGAILPAITGIIAANEVAYQAYIDANPGLFGYPATAAEVQAMVTTVNAAVIAEAASNTVLTQIGNEADSPNTVASTVTIAQLEAILPAITGIVTANESAYQAYIDANPNLFSSPATAAEVQAMVTAVNAQVTAQAASNSALTQIGNEADAPNTITSTVTVAQLGAILPAITGIVTANGSAYQAYIDANPNLFSSPATAAEVQAMVTAVNAQVTAQAASNSALTQIGNEADAPNTVPSTVTVAQLGAILPIITGIVTANEAAYQAYVDANPNLFSSPATATEVQAMVTAVNAQVTAQAASNSTLTQIGNEADSPNTVTSTVTLAQLGAILPAITGIVTANEAAYQAYIDANPDLFSAPATATEVQAMVTVVNASSSSVAASNASLAQIGNEADAPNTVPSTVTVAQLGAILPAITGIVTANEAAYQAYIDANPNLFSSPATATEVQAMVTAVNAQVTAQAASNNALTQIGNEADSPNTVTSTVTLAQFGVILPAITGIVTANEAAYQAYIDANPDLFSAPATAAEVQAMVTAVNAQVTAQAASNSTLTQIGNEADAPNTVTSTVTLAQLGAILPAITGIVTANEVAYQAYIDANPDLFSAPATATEVQAMVTAVNAQVTAQAASNSTLTQIGNEADAPNTVTSTVTLAQLGAILPAITGIVTANESAYQAYIDANPNLFSSPATAAEVQAMVTVVNAQVTAQAASNSALTQIGNEADAPNTVTSTVTVVQLGAIIPAITGIVTANEAAYQAYIDANPNLFSSPATAAEVQAMVTVVNASSSSVAASNASLAQIGNEADAPNTVPSTVTVAQLGAILPAITGIVTANEAAYQAYIDANPNLFSSPATATEVQAMVTAVNAQVTAQAASNNALTQIGNEADSPNTVTSTVTLAQLGVILPAITGIVTANEAAYQAYIDANPDLFSAPATAAEVQAMVTAVNAQVTAQAASNSTLTQIGNEADAPNTVTSTVTLAQLGAILPAITGIVTANEVAYQAYIDANPDLFSAPATATEVQAMVTAVNAQVTAQAASNSTLTQIGNEADAPNTVTSTVTLAQLGAIIPAITGIVTANEVAYQAYIDANPDLFSAPATAAEVQAMVTAVNAALATNDFDIRNVSIYPNPSNAVFNIEIATNATIELYDAIGKSLKSDKITVGVTALNLSNYSDGVYFLKITNESNQTKTVRLIKK